MKRYDQALADTAAQAGTLVRDSPEEKQAVARFISFYRVFSDEVIRRDLRGLYADCAYFADGFKEAEGIAAVEAYFLASAEGLESCTFDVQDMAVQQGNYYFRWVMALTMKRRPGAPVRTVGMSHVRFDATGKVTFHQDYWDTGAVYDKVPILGMVIRWIKKRF
jgi:steroid delta-isomerase